MEKYFIKNRKGQNVCVVLEKAEDQKGLAFVMHGLSGNKDQPHIATIAEAFKQKGYTVVRFDTTNTFGESDGKYEDATITNYYEDLEDVVEASTLEEWYQEPFVLVGSSLGGICVALYAIRHPGRVKGVAPISTVVSGALSLQSKSHKAQNIEEWERTGWIEEESKSTPGRIKRLKWSHIVDRLTYDLLPDAHILTMPVLMVVGKQDDMTPLEHQQLLFEKLPVPKELHIIKDAPHTFREQKHFDEIKKIFIQWIDTLI
ncbi:MAG: alpha/beta hydrolase [bacterium]|nr:alpha/beta hydrolase [bacterium]